MVYTTEKTMNENKDKLSEADQAPLETALAKAKKVLEQEGATADEMKKSIEELTQASHKLAEVMYQQAAQSQAQGTDGGVGPDAAGGGSDESKPGDDVIDAEYEDAK
jgi:molecular chaperone DnaK